MVEFIKARKIANLFFAVTSFAAMMSCNTDSKKIMIENPTANNRKEVVECKLPFDNCNNLIISCEDGKSVDYQITKDGKLLIAADVAANSKLELTASLSESQQPEIKTITCGKQYPNRLDDLAWENDRAAFRTYGPALQKTGEKGFGFDFWAKRVDYPVVDERYKLELNPETCRKRDSLFATGKPEDHDSAWVIIRNTSYHFDHGNGLDCYKVGPTLGCGTPALLVDSQLVYPWCYKELEILENGPLRFKAVLTYDSVTVGNLSFVEKRTITLDAFSHLNFTELEYVGLNNEQDVAIGLAVRDSLPNARNITENFISSTDPTDRPTEDYGKVFTGVVFDSQTPENCYYLPLENDEERKFRGSFGHVLSVFKLKPNEKLCYYWGAAWSKYDIPTVEDWYKYLETYSENLKHPLKVETNY